MNRISELRKAAGYTQIDLCEELNLTQSALSQYETGKRIPDSDTIQKLADKFNVSACYIMGVDIPEEKDYSLANVTKLVEHSDLRTVNTLLDLGWKLVHIYTRYDNNGEFAYSYTLYVLGWYGVPNEAPLTRPKDDSDYNFSF